MEGAPPRGYTFRPKYAIPDRDEDVYCDGVRLMCAEGGDEHEVDGEAKSHGVDPDFWQQPGEMMPRVCEDSPEMVAQFPDSWCHRQSDTQLLAMYGRQYDCSGIAMGIVPTAALYLGSELVERMIPLQRQCGMHDPRRLSPLLQQVKRAYAAVLQEGGPAAFEQIVALLSGLDPTRGDCGWHYVIGRSGEVVPDFTKLMNTALACVVLGLENSGTAASTPEWTRAVLTALDMRDNFDNIGGHEDPRLEAYFALLSAGDSDDSDGGAAGSQPLTCEPSELGAALQDFCAMYGDEVGEHEWAADDRVTIYGLQAAPQHNGLKGKVTTRGFKASNGRYQVMLFDGPNSGETLSVKPINLIKTAEADSARAAEAASARAATVATGAASSKEEYVARMTAEVGAVVANIECGDCPLELEAAWVWCQADDWQNTGGIKVLTNYEQRASIMSNMKGTRDAETLEYLFEKGAFGDAARQLGIDVIEEAASQISAAAIGAAIDIVVVECEGVPDDEAWIPAGDAERLKHKFQTWLKGVTWGKTYLSPTNRPSLASWEGDPWSASHIMSHRSCGLRSGIPPDSPLIVTWWVPSSL